MVIILYGGAFNPVHTEHVALAKAAVKKFSPDRLIVIPTAVSPHKSGGLLASAEDRLQMCRLAFSSLPCAEVSDFEICSGGVSYSYITCEHFKKQFPGADIYFLVGGDMLASFPSWREPERILACVTLIACAREDKKALKRSRSEVERLYSVKVERLSYVGRAVSSTRVRALACLGADFSVLVPAPVAEYMRQRGVYYNERLARASAFEKKSRWAHSVRVAAMCAENASRARLTEEAAITMAALHDVTKNLPKDSPYLSGFVPPEGVPSPVMHQYSGAYVAREYFGVTDENLLNAIRYHTSGRAGMSPAEMLLYLADMLEEGRSFPGVEGLRRIFYQGDLSHAMLAALEHQVEYLNSEGEEIYPLTKQAYLYLKEFLT